jgi:hypothetical protein
MRTSTLGLFLLASTALTGCATFKPPQIGYDDEPPGEPAVLQSDPPPSSPREFHPEALTEPYVTVSRHTARATH